MEQMYFDLTVTMFTKNLNVLKTLLEKGWEAATAADMSEADYLAQKLSPDMFPLLKQVQIVTDNAKGAVARLTKSEMITLEDTEVTMAELIARIDTVLNHLQTYTPEQFAGAAEEKITLHYMPEQYQLGQDYLLDFVLPNFFFHLTTAYAIIRVQGVEIGKRDFIGSLKLHPLA